MRRDWTIAAVLAGCLVGSACAHKKSSGNGGLVSIEVNRKATDGGKDLIMKFEEVERRDGVSVVRVRHESGASVASIMFVAKGMCQIAKRRGARYFGTMKEWINDRGEWMYLEAFTSGKDVDLKRMCGADCDAPIDANALTSVEDCEFL